MYAHLGAGSVWTLATLELQQVLQSSSAKCELEFWYHMIEDETLSVDLLEGYDSVELWESYRAVNDQWERVILPIGRVARPWRLQFLAETGFDDGSIAIDDIRLIGCQFPPVRDNCTDEQFRCKRGACVPKDRVCDFT